MLEINEFYNRGKRWKVAFVDKFNDLLHQVEKRERERVREKKVKGNANSLKHFFEILFHILNCKTKGHGWFDALFYLLVASSFDIFFLSSLEVN